MFKKLLITFSLVISSLAIAKPKVIELNEKNTVLFNDVFTNEFVSKKQIEIIKKRAELGEDKKLYLVLDTPGGSVVAGNILRSTLKAFGDNIDTITIYAASMGYNTVQALGTRYILPNGILMSHRASIRGLSGEIGGELDSRYRFYKKLTESLDKMSAKRVGLSIEEYNKLVSDEFYTVGQEAVNSNHADEVALIKCDESLLKTEDRTIRTFFGPLKVTFSKCPLVRGPLKISGKNLAKQLILNTRYKHVNTLIK